MQVGLIHLCEYVYYAYFLSTKYDVIKQNELELANTDF